MRSVTVGGSTNLLMEHDCIVFDPSDADVFKGGLKSIVYIDGIFPQFSRVQYL